MTPSYKPPSGWRFPTIEEIALQERGAIRIGPFGSALKKHEYSEAGVRVLGIEDVLPNQLVSESRKFIPEAKYRELSRYTVSPGDILVTNMGTVGRTCVVPDDLQRSIISSHLIKVTFDLEAVWPSYISWMLNFCPFVVAQVKAKCHGAIMAGFNSGLLKQLRVPLPPLAEQRRIADVLDRADALRTKRRAALAQLDSLTQSIFLDLFGNPIHNERKWPVSELRSMSQVERGKFTPRPRGNPTYYGGQFPFIQTGDISSSGGRLNSWSQTLNEKGVRVSRSFPTGTVVIAIVGATLGITAILGTEVYCPDSVVGIQPHASKASAEYIDRVLRFWRPIFVAQAPETARANINLETLRPLRIPLPPIALQREFARRVAAVEKLKAAQRASLAELDALFASLQHRAFRGEL